MPFIIRPFVSHAISNFLSGFDFFLPCLLLEKKTRIKCCLEKNKQKRTPCWVQDAHPDFYQYLPGRF